jgi:hypothetical protein
MCALACAHYARGCTHMRACVRSHIFGRISYKIGENIPLRRLHAFYVRTYVCTLCACVHCTHVRAHTLLDGFSPKLTKTFLGSQKLARHACVCTLCAWMHARAHVCVRTFLNVLAPTLEKTSLCVGYMLFTCTLACAHYARTKRVRALHACARSHMFGRILSKLGVTFYGSQKVAWTT